MLIRETQLQIFVSIILILNQVCLETLSSKAIIIELKVKGLNLNLQLNDKSKSSQSSDQQSGGVTAQPHGAN